MSQAYRDDKNTKFRVADSSVLSALPSAVARFAVGSGIAWQRAALAVVRDGALFMTLYLLCVASLVGGEDDAGLVELETAKPPGHWQHASAGAGANAAGGGYPEEGGGDFGGGCLKRAYRAGAKGDVDGGAGGWQEMEGGISVRNVPS